MASEDAQLVVALEARIRDFERNFQKAARISDDNWQRIEARGKSGAANVSNALANATRGVSEHMGRMAREAAGALAASLGIEELRKMADEWTSFRGKIAASGVATEDLNGKLRELSDIAIRSHASLETVATVYTSLRRAAAELGASEAQTIRATETLQKALTLGGQSPETTKAAVLEITHALSGGMINGQELNKLLMEAPVLVAAIAKEFGVTTGQLRALKEEGQQLSADKVFAGILHGSQDIEAAFAKLKPTISQSIQVLQTSLTRYVGEADQADGVSRLLASGIMTLAENINVTAPAAFALAAGLTGLFVGGPLVGGITAATVALIGFSDQIHPIQGDLASLADYAVVAWQLIKDKGGEAARYLEDQFAEVATSLSNAMSGLGEGLEPFSGAVKTLVNATIGAFVFAVRSIVISWEALGPELAEVTLDAVNGVVSAVEGMVNKVVEAINAVIEGLNKISHANLSPMATVDLGRVENAYAGAANATAKAFGDAFKDSFKDYVGGALDAGKQAIGKIESWRDRANKKAAEKAKDNKPAKPGDEGSLDQTLKSNPDPKKVKAYNEIINKTKEFIQAQELERRELTETAEAASALRHEQELLNEASSKEINLTDEQKAQLKSLAEDMAHAEQATQKLVDMKAGITQLGESITDNLVTALDAVISRSKTWYSALANLGRMLTKTALDAMLWGKGPLAEITGTKDNGVLNGVVRGMLPKSDAKPQQFLPTPAIPINAGTVNVNGTTVNGASMQSTTSNVAPEGHGGIGSDAVASAHAAAHVSTTDAASAAAQAGSPTAQSVAERLMKDYGLTRQQAIGATGVMGYESGNFQTMQEKGHSGVNSGWGYAQWTGPRRQQFMDYAQKNGLDPSSDQANYGFLRHELDTNYSHVVPAMKRTTGVEDAARTWEEQYEGMREGGPGVPAFQAHVNRALQYDTQLPQDLGTNNATKAIDDALTKGASSVTRGFSTVDTSLNQGASGIGGALQSLTSSLTSGKGGLLSIIPGFADGGLINGSGSGTSDSNLAAVSDGEFIVNAASASKHRDLLEMINRGEAPNFVKSGASTFANLATHFAPTLNISVAGGGEGKQLATQIAAHVSNALDAAKTDHFRLVAISSG